MALLPVFVPPGVRRAGTEYLSQGRWYDSNLMRWYEGAMMPVGGWAEVAGTSSITTTPNCIVSWRANDGAIWTAIGTESKIYAYNAGTLTDITPVASFTAGTPGSTGSAPYGAGVYGSGLYSAGGSVAGTPGVSTPGITVVEGASWQLDTFGEILLGVLSSDGQLWYWDLDVANNMALADSVTPAPIDNVGVVVTPERFVMLLGAGGDPRTVQWADQEVYLDWGTITQAGSFLLEGRGRLVAGVALPRETLLFTDVEVFSAIYIGGDLIYSFERRGDNCGLVAPHAKAKVGDVAYWMSDSGFFKYDGSVTQLPCEVHDYVFSSINFAQKRKIWGVTNSRYSEVWFFYPSADSESIDRYVVYNYREGHWAIGQMNRTAGIDRGSTTYPIWADEDGNIYEHELNFNRPGQVTSPYARSGPVEIGQGDLTYMVRRVVPDEQTQGEVELTFYTRLPGPLGTEYTHGPYTVTSPTSVRFTGRQVAMKIEEAGTDTDFRVGRIRVDAMPAGER